MKLLHCICFTTFLVLLKSNSVTPQTEIEKEIAAVLVAEYTPVQDDFKTGVTKVLVKYISLPHLNFGNRLTFSFEEKNETATLRATILALNQSGGVYAIQQHKLINGGSLENPSSLTADQLQFLGHECDKTISLENNHYRGRYPACAMPLRADGKPIVFDVGLNCTHYTLTKGNLKVIFHPTQRFTLPDDLKPAKTLC